MGLFDRFNRRKTDNVIAQPVIKPKEKLSAAAMLDNTSDTTHTYDNRNITFTGSLEGYDYDSILRDKQNNINSLYELAEYYVDKDPIVRGIIKGVYASFSVTPWKLVGQSEKIKQKYEQYYERIHLRDRMASIFYQYFKYGNVYIYLMEDGNITTLPVHKTRISNVMVNGEPVLEFNAQSIQTDTFNQGVAAVKTFLDDDDIEIKLHGFPKEVAEGVKSNQQWVQLNPENTFVLQDLKEDWVRYAVPLIAACLTGLAKKALIESYEDSLLNLGINSFVHVRYGDDKNDNPASMPNRSELTAVNNIFRKAMKGSALATTNNWAKAEVIQADTKDLFEYDKYKHVNSEILSAGGISGIIVSGRAEDGSTFATAQVSLNTADKRIELARSNFCELMNKINRRVNGSVLTRSSTDKVPEFKLVPVDLSGSSAFQKTCLELWKLGCVSTETMLQEHNIDMGQEIERKEKEISDGSHDLLRNIEKSNSNDNAPGETKKVGRPELSNEERTSDPGKAQTGKQPKPSNPEGSLDG